MNLYIGFGVGSYAQGDVLGGTVCLAGGLSGLGLMIGGLSYASYNTGTNNGVFYGMMIGGAALYFGSAIYGYIRPWLFD